jgi:hypothetical protein
LESHLVKEKAMRKKEVDPIRKLLTELGIPQGVLQYSDQSIVMHGDGYRSLAGWSWRDHPEEKNCWWIEDRELREYIFRTQTEGECVFQGGYVIVQWRKVTRKEWPWEVFKIVVRTDFKKSRNEIVEWLRDKLPG